MLTQLGARPSDVVPRHRSGGVPRRTPVFVVCSPRPRVGRTLIARLLVDHLINDERAPLAFDVNPDDPVLSAYQPRRTMPATVADILGEMALFDRLILRDERPKVIDLAPDLFNAFFDSAETIAFVESARANRIDTAALFVIENHTRSIAAYGDLLRRFPEMTLVPVVNEMLYPVGSPVARLPEGGAPPLRIAELPPTLHGVVMRPRFSFSDYFMNQSGQRTLLHRWIADCFVGFRDIELRLQMAEFADLFAAAV